MLRQRTHGDASATCVLRQGGAYFFLAFFFAFFLPAFFAAFFFVFFLVAMDILLFEARIGR